MALQASVSAFNIENQDTIETRNKLAVLSNDDLEEDDFELRSLSSYSQQLFPKSNSIQNITNYLDAPSLSPRSTQSSELKQPQDTKTERSLSHQSLTYVESQHSQQDQSQPQQDAKTQLTTPRNNEQETGQSIKGTYEPSIPGTKDDKTVSFAADHSEFLPPTQDQSLKQKIFTLLDKPKSSKLVFV